MKNFSFIILIMMFIFSCSEKKEVEVVANNDFCELQEEGVEAISYLLVNEFDLMKFKGTEIIKLLGPKEKFPNNKKSSLIIFLGKRSSNVYSIEFLKSDVTNKTFRIFIKEVYKVGVNPVVTYPCLTLSIPISNKEIEIVWEGDPLEDPHIQKGTTEYQ